MSFIVSSMAALAFAIPGWQHAPRWRLHTNVALPHRAHVNTKSHRHLRRKVDA